MTFERNRSKFCSLVSCCIVVSTGLKQSLPNTCIHMLCPWSSVEKKLFQHWHLRLDLEQWHEQLSKSIPILCRAQVLLWSTKNTGGGQVLQDPSSMNHSLGPLFLWDSHHHHFCCPHLLGQKWQLHRQQRRQTAFFPGFDDPELACYSATSFSNSRNCKDRVSDLESIWTKPWKMGDWMDNFS